MERLFNDLTKIAENIQEISQHCTNEELSKLRILLFKMIEELEQSSDSEVLNEVEVLNEIDSIINKDFTGIRGARPTRLIRVKGLFAGRVNKLIPVSEFIDTFGIKPDNASNTVRKTVSEVNKILRLIGLEIYAFHGYGLRRRSKD